MTHPSPKTAPTARAAIAGLSALLVVSLVLGASFNNPDRAVRDSVREAHRDQAPVRHLTVTLAKAVRHLVGGDTHKPALAERFAPVCSGSAAPAVARSSRVSGVQAPQLVRLERLDLPPPGAPC